MRQQFGLIPSLGVVETMADGVFATVSDSDKVTRRLASRFVSTDQISLFFDRNQNGLSWNSSWTRSLVGDTMSILALLLGSLSTAYAVPVQLSQQGRLLEANGAAVTGSHTLTFRLFDSQFGGNLMWEDSQSVGFTEGYYATLLGNNLSNPLDDSVLASSALYLEVSVDGGSPVGVRQPVVSAPYSRLSETATNLSGGDVDANAVSVGGQLVFDNSGSWVGPAMAVTG